MVNLTVNRADAVNGPPLVAPVYFSNDAVGPRGKFNAPSEKRIVNTARDEIEAVTDAKLFERVGFHLIRVFAGGIALERPDPLRLRSVCQRQSDI